MDPLFASAVPKGQLALLAGRAGEALKRAGQSVAVFEATTAGLITACLQAVPGASAYTTCGAVSYSPKKAVPVLGADLSRPKPPDGAAYRDSKVAWTRDLARSKRAEVGATWCISENGACGPTFNYDDVKTGFTAIFVSGPVERGILVESPHADREENMWTYAKLALDLLAECVEEAASQAAPAAVEAAGKLVAKEDRYGGVEVEVPEEGLSAPECGRELGQRLEEWKAAGKQGIWLKVPLQSAGCVAPAVAHGFAYHHAKPDYALLTRWLPETHSPLPKYGFHQIGVGGVVVNSKNEVLMVQERISPIPRYQGCWKLPGGLADPAEHFAETVMREVREETGVTGSLIGIVSLRHSHGYRFGQGDIYVVAKLQADNEDIKIDPHELQDAQWMSKDKIESLVATASTESLDGLVSQNNWKMIENAFNGTLIAGSELPSAYGGKQTMLYMAPKSAI